MTMLRQEDTILETSGESAVISHQSYDPAVHAVCHHSGRYLTQAETNPQPLMYLREQHDFPGLPVLDRSFAQAAHALQHQHPVWSRPTIQAVGLALSGVLILACRTYVWRYQPYVAEGLPLTLFTVFMALMIVVALALILWAVYLVAQRETIFHARAAGMPPAIADYPVEATYEIEAHEEAIVALGNTPGAGSDVSQQPTHLKVTAHPAANDLEGYTFYRTFYRDHQVGDYLHAGALALEGTKDVTFTPGAVEFDHRVVLRVPRTAVEEADDKRFKPFSVEVPYAIQRSVLFQLEDGEEGFLVECRPRLIARDSRALRLCFRWRGAGPVPELKLRSCTLAAPYELGKVTRVVAGRYDPDGMQAQWHNLPFTGTSLELRLFFEQPVLSYQEKLTGSYELAFEGLMSGLNISPDRLWTAWGLKAKAGASVVRRESVIRGDLQLDLRRLAQEHEHVQSISIACDAPPDYQTVRAISDVLLAEGVDLLRVAQAAPRLNPAGSLDTRLHYWDVAGRHYTEGRMDPFDIHVVISGHAPVAMARTDQAPGPQTQIDLTVRCLHDPRNQETPQSADDLLSHEDGYGHDLAGRIRKAVGAMKRA